MLLLLGYIGTLCLVISAVPQAIQSWMQGHSQGVSGAFLALTIAGFALMLVYLMLTDPIAPVLVSYWVNLIMMLVIAYYKLFPREKT